MCNRFCGRLCQNAPTSVMEELHESIHEKDYSKKPLICIMDGALIQWTILKEVQGGGLQVGKMF